ncbi:MAG TPA: hypothetical protein VE775_10620, partial [Pyrinomonadaceae bacterium]|nr:hypothetical protein [Pyrinomonadaceae bacterium]
MPTAFAFSADEKFLAASGFNGAITVRDIESGRTTQTLAGHSNFAFGVAFSADGTRLVSGGRTIWDLTTGRGLRAARSAEPLGLMSRDGRLLAAATFNDSRITLYDTNTQRRLFTLTPDDPPSLKVAPANAPHAAQAIVQPPAFSPDGRLLATFYTVPADNTQPAQVDAKAAQKAQKEMLKNMSRNPAAAMQAYNDALAKASGRGDSLANQIKLWDTQTGREVRTLVVAGGNAYAPAQIKAVTFSADGRLLAVVAHNSAVVTLWDVTTGAQVGVIGAPPAASANPYGLPGMPGAGAQMPNIAQLPGMQQMFGGQANVESVAFSADGRTLAVGGQEVTRSFDMAAMMGQMSAAMRDPKAAQANSAALQQQLLKQMKQTTAGTLKLYDAATGRELRAFAGLASEVKVVAFSPDGRLLASAATDNA